jgi:hypothetical protein
MYLYTLYIYIYRDDSSLETTEGTEINILNHRTVITESSEGSNGAMDRLLEKQIKLFHAVRQRFIQFCSCNFSAEGIVTGFTDCGGVCPRI